MISLFISLFLGKDQERKFMNLFNLAWLFQSKGNHLNARVENFRVLEALETLSNDGDAKVRGYLCSIIKTV